MAGSLKTFKYDRSPDSSGDYVAYRADESNLEDIIVAAGAYDNASGSIYDFLPADEGVINDWMPTGRKTYFKPRKAVFKGADGVSVREVIIPSQAMFNDLETNNTANITRNFTTTLEDGTSMQFTLDRLIPQYRKLAIAADTGLTDGDTT